MDDEDKCVVRDISKKLDLIFMYYCPREPSRDGKAKRLAKELTERAKILFPDKIKINKTGEEIDIISSKTLTDWSKDKHRSCNPKTVEMFTDLLKLNFSIFRDQSVEPFLRDLVSSVTTLGSLFKKFHKSQVTHWKRLRGFYSAYYTTPDGNTPLSLLYLCNPIKYSASLKLCCIFDNAQTDYTGYWSFEAENFYAFFEGPAQDGLSSIIANLPSAKINQIFEGILLSVDIANLKSPFASKILIIPELTGRTLDNYLLETGKNTDDIWKELRAKIPQKYFSSDEIKKKIGDQAYNLTNEDFIKTVIAFRETTNQLGKVEIPFLSSILTIFDLPKKRK